ncbi:UDP-N-acetylmuramoyl-L-alanine--D-glutamate ligase [Treponema pectinovorum]|uniref:UDP-N-acetylmuramoyl-L-alanine--D-glutamate ligase n=1 Tax=Treponema pectinovorum TaxID=164 RepID=UPI0011C9826A|nr:UDP-N-acetylmuramoyl-L-alanine--D-glutamate ligase [Treponema pectinovorum]
MSQIKEPLPPVPKIYPEGCFFKTLKDIKDKKIVVMGLGVNGGGEATVRFLLKWGAKVLVTDMKTKEELQPSIQSLSNDKTLDKTNLTYRLGEHRIEDFIEADCVIKNPGVKYDGNEYLKVAKAIESDISLFLNFTKAPIIAVTGSKGKSSTVSAIHYGLKQAGFDAYLGGNITVSPLTFLEKTNSTTPVILELSSWQLADLHGRKLLKPHIAIITKIIPDHQNFYHSMLAYVADKKLIYADQTKDDFLILDFDDDRAADGGTLIENWGNVFAKEAKAQILRYSKKKLPEGIYGVWQDKNLNGVCRLPEKLMSLHSREHHKETETILKDLLVPGKHMRLNVLNAALVLQLMGIEPKKTIAILGKWNGIEHRLEYFHSYSTKNSTGKQISVKFYNDSAATVPEAAAEATQAFGKPIIFITGGTDKGLDLSPIADALCKSSNIKPEAIYLLKGSATDKIQTDLNSRGISYNGPFVSLEELLKALKEKLILNEGTSEKTVVFSPGATSFGMFTNEFDRGNKFKAAVKEIFC